MLWYICKYLHNVKYTSNSSVFAYHCCYGFMKLCKCTVISYLFGAHVEICLGTDQPTGLGYEDIYFILLGVSQARQRTVTPLETVILNANWNK